jgi:hypothetical protein
MRISNNTWVALAAGAAALAGCSSGGGRNEVASRPAPAPLPPIAQPAPPPPVVVISPQEALWNMRSALNVAALSCRGSRMPGVAPAYNRMLSRHKAPLAEAYAAVQAKYMALPGRGTMIATRPAFTIAMPCPPRSFSSAARRPPCWQAPTA